MIVLSLFDGISCGQLALQRANIPVSIYFASEIDKNAIKVTQHHFPNTIQLGDVNNIDFTQFAGGVDLLIGGSPCQDLSIAKSNGEGLEGKKSSLFFKFVEALRIIKPKYFLLENVKMKRQYQDVMSEYLGVEPIYINSNIVSGQNRRRLYWTNIPIPKTEIREIKLQDILEYGYADRNKSLCIRRRYAEEMGSQAYLCRRYFGKRFSQMVFKSQEARDRIYDMWKNNPYFETEEKLLRPLTSLECERLQTLPDNYTACLESEIKRKEVIGNGWTVDVIAEIFKGIPSNK